MTEQQANAPATPGTIGLFDNPEFVRNPYGLFKIMRDSSPVVQLGGDVGLWAVTRYDDVVRVLRDWETFSSRVDARSMRGEARPPTILFDDPPSHTRMRGLISKAFTPRTVELQRDAIEENCRRLVDAMLQHEEADAVAGLAYPLPVMVIATMLGVQDGDLATFKRWSDAIIENLGPTLLTGDDSALLEINAEFDAYFRARLDKLRREPEDNLLSELVHAETEDGRLSEEDLLVVCRVLLVAGNETTTGLIVNAIRAFSDYPEEWDRLREHPELVQSAIEEVLRFYSPFPATFRRAMRDVEIGGVRIPKDARLLPLMASANRDERAFENPDQFIIDREPNRHLAFGMGIHYCVGAPLARLEGEIAVRELMRRVRRMKVVHEDGEELMRPGGPKSMMVRFELDRAVARV